MRRQGAESRRTLAFDLDRDVVMLQYILEPQRTSQMFEINPAGFVGHCLNSFQLSKRVKEGSSVVFGQEDRRGRTVRFGDDPKLHLVPIVVDREKAKSVRQ